MFNDSFTVTQTVPCGSCGYQALGIFLHISWVKVIEVLSHILKSCDSAEERQRGAVIEEEIDFNNDSIVDIDKKIWLTGSDLKLLADYYKIAILLFAHCSGKLYIGCFVCNIVLI